MLRFLSSPRVAWLIAAVSVIALAVGFWSWKLSGWRADDPRFNYAAAAERRSAEDRSQPLRMLLEAQFPGPLKDTTIQRWRDPIDGTICYIYLPIAVAHAEGPGGLLQYGAASIGSMSCFRGPPPTRD